MHIVLDIALAAIFLSIAFAGWRRGFFRTLMSFASYIIALVVANMFGERLGEYISRTYLAEGFKTGLLERFASILARPVEGLDMNVLLEDRPREFLSILSGFGVRPEEVSVMLDQQAAAASAAANEAVAEKIVSPVVTALSGAIAFALLFAASLIILKLITIIIDKITRLPVLNTINRTLGLALGVVAGLLVCCVFVVAASYALPYIQSNTALGGGLTAREIADSSLLFKALYEYVPFTHSLG